MSCSTVYLTGSSSLLGLKCDEFNYDDGGVYYTPNTNGVGYRLLPFTSESFNPNGDIYNSEAIGSTRARLNQGVSNRTGDGNFDTELTYENIGYLLYGVTGKGNDTYAPDNLLPKYNVIIRHGTSYAFKSICAMFNSFAFNFSSNAYISASIDMMGNSYTLGATEFGSSVFGNAGTGAVATEITALNGNTLIQPEHLVTASSYFTILDGNGDTVGGDASGYISINDNVSAISFTINNNLDGSANNLDGESRLTVVPGWFTVTGSITIHPNDAQSVEGEEVEAAKAISPAELAAVDVGTYKIGTLILAFNSGTTNETITLTFNSLRITNKTDDVSGQGLIPIVLDFEAYGSSPFKYTLGAAISGMTNYIALPSYVAT